MSKGHRNMCILSVDFHIKPKNGTPFAHNIDVHGVKWDEGPLEIALESLKDSSVWKEGHTIYSVRIIDWGLAEDFGMTVPLPKAPSE